mmetsp:Transcript_36985/g.102796  ORF Transcript_36985/g.102796 Transcript_36985/m.102796 type:complete len:246 (+) Transcript_36985:238-975(+)
MSHLLCGDDTLQACVNCQAVNAHVQLADDVADGEVHEKWNHRVEVRMHRLQHKVPGNCCTRHDEEETDGMDHSPEHSDHAKPKHVLGDDLPSLLSRRAEWCAPQRNLDVRILVQEPDKPLQTPDAVLHHFEDAGHNPVLLSLCLLLEIHHQVPDKLHHSEDEGAKGQRANVEAENVDHGIPDRVHLPLLVVWSEEPDSCGASNAGLPQGDDEGIVPQKDEEGYEKARIEDVARWGTFPALRSVFF